MEEADRDRITTRLTRLVQHTQWNDKLEEHLLSIGVFKPKMIQSIKANPDASSIVRQLYLDVQKRGPKAFSGLVSALSESGNQIAANILDPRVQVPILPSPIPEDTHNRVWNLPTYSVPPPDTPVHPLEFFKAAPRLELSLDPLRIEVKPATQFRGPPSMPNVYPLTKKIRGQCLIIDNEKFVNDVLPFREGSKIDSNNLDMLFEQLNFKVTVRRNLSYSEMMSTIGKFADLEEHEDAQMCIVVILSHGEAGGLINAADKRELPTEYVLRRFNNDSCKKLKGKPKFFVFQACRGDEVDYGTIPQLETQESAVCSVDASGFVMDDYAARQTIAKDPTWEDMVILWATIPGYVANRNLYRGTWLIECLCYVFMNHACDLDLREMLDEVSRMLSTYESERGFKQSCSYENRHFYNKLYFNPGIVLEE